MCRGAQPGRTGSLPMPPPPCLLPPSAPLQVPAFSPSSHCTDPLRPHSCPQGPELTQGPGMSTHPRWSPLWNRLWVPPPSLLFGIVFGKHFHFLSPPLHCFGKTLSVLLCCHLMGSQRKRWVHRCALTPAFSLACRWTPLPWCRKRSWTVEPPDLGHEDGRNAAAEIGMKSTGWSSRPLRLKPQ